MAPNALQSADPVDASSEPASGSNRARFWRSLSELQQKEDFNQYLHREFPVAASEFPEGVSRRRWLQIMGASLAMAGVAGCRYPEELIAPFVLRPEGRVPGESYLRATNFELAGRVYNLLISCVDGRPTKVEPNTDHPANFGTDVYSQASVLALYDPDRMRGEDVTLLKINDDGRREAADWEDFQRYATTLVRSAAGNRGGGSTAVLVESTQSPSVVRMLLKLKERLPNVTIARYDPVSGGVMRSATRQAFGKEGRQVLNLGDAKVVVALQADILGADPGFLNNAAGFAKQRNPIDGSINRLYVVEGGYTATGAAADSRLSLRPSQMPAFLAELRRRVDALKAGESHEHADEDKAFDELSHEERLERYLDVLSHDVADAGAGAVIVVGEHLGEDAIAAGIDFNESLGSLGTLQKFVAPVDAQLGQAASLAQLADKAGKGELDSLIIIGGNPVFAAPSDVDVQTLLRSVENTVYLGEYDDETAVLCDWSVPVAHPLESWGDVFNDRGHYGVCQPNILPLLGGRSVPEILAMMLGDDQTDGEQIVRATAQSLASGPLAMRQWRKLLHDGFADNLVANEESFNLIGDAPELPGEGPVAVAEANQDEIEVIFTPADGLYDGRFANSGWLQELPQALTKLTWDNAALMSPSTAATLKVSHGSMVAIRKGDALVTLPVYEMPGMAPGVVSTAIGYGRPRAGMVGGMPSEGVPVVGTDVSSIRDSNSMLIAFQMEARPRYTDYVLATTQDHWAIDELGRGETEERSFKLVREGTMPLLEKLPNFVEALEPHVPKVGEHGSLWNEPIETIEETQEYLPQWAMGIDLSKCIACNACVVACQSENNVPIVGKEQVNNSREMHWLRIDRYFQGDAEFADVAQEPVACMHCETAPCEQVCPVAATVHTEEGLNAMTYNRCIGTRYCGNNCPFKVRRFNYFNYNEDIGVGYGIDAYPSNIESANRKLQALVMNPEVTVRGRGVMEKCTYCVQRIEKAKIQARKEGGRRIRDGDVITACQAACPTNAIEFGSISDPDSKVSKIRKDVRNYGMLSQLNVKPRTTYLARIRNTPERLLTRQQIQYINELEVHHAGDHGGDHGGHGEHGDDHHGDEQHDDHHHDDHGSDTEQT